MKRISARKCLDLSIEELWDTITGEFILVFDDGEIQTDAHMTLFSVYAWDFHRMYKKTPMLMKHHAQHILDGKRLSASTHTTLLANAMWSVYDVYEPLSRRKEDSIIDRDQLSEMIYRLTNRMYNDLSYRCEEYVVSLDILDFIEVMNHPKVVEVMDAIAPTQQSIDSAYAVIRGVLSSPTELPHNAISMATRSKVANMNQALQCLGPRGYLTDTNSELFSRPILRGYAKGIREFHDSLIESRSAAKALIFSKSPLQQAEYFSRRLQLMTQNVQHLNRGDCGSTDYLLWNVRGPSSTSDGDLGNLAGKYYMCDTDKRLKEIKKTDRHLIGKTLKIRSVLHCHDEDPYGICETCFGALSLSVPENSNIGHMCCTSMTQKSSQMVLSVKHLDGSSVVEGIVLSLDDRKFLRIGSDENTYLLASELKSPDKTIHLVIPVDDAPNISDIREVGDIHELHIARVSELMNIGIEVKDTSVRKRRASDVAGAEAVIDRVSVPVNIGRRLASLTYPLLEHIRKVGWGVDEVGNYTIDMTDWDWEKPILALPLKHFNMSDHSRDIANMLESRVDEMHLRDKVVSPEAFLVELYDLVNDKLVVNLAVLEVILFGAMIRSAENNDYALPKKGTPAGLGVMALSMVNRSLSATMAYQGQRDMIMNPLSYTLTNRMDHPMDGILCPLEVFHKREGPTHV